MKTITTLSGAVYNVFKDGAVKRVSAVKEMRLTRDGYQYTEGFLPDGYGYDDIKVGQSLLWMGVVHDYTEPVTSSTIVNITEETI